MKSKKALSLLATASTFILEVTPKSLSKSKEWRGVTDTIVNLLSTCTAVGFLTACPIKGTENNANDAYKALESSILKTQTEVQKQLQAENPHTTRALVIGVTGSGKSTLVHSLALYAKSLA